MIHDSSDEPDREPEYSRRSQAVPAAKVINWLKENKVFCKRPSKFQIKVGKLNFYPTSGKIVVDGDTYTASRSGFETFKKLILKQKSSL